MTEQVVAQKMHKKGYRFRIVFSDNPEDGPMAKSKCRPIYVKNMSDIGPLFRTEFPNDKNWIAQEIDSDGNVIPK